MSLARYLLGVGALLCVPHVVFFTTRLVQSAEVDWTRTDPARLVLSPSQAIQVFRLTGPLTMIAADGRT